MRLHDKTSSNVSDVSNGIIPLAVPASSVFGFIDRDPDEFAFGSEARSKWHFEFDSLDFQIGKTCYFYNCLRTRPYLGVKGARIKQSQQINYLGFSLNDTIVNIENNKRNDFKGIGPSFGIDLGWEFYPQVQLTAGLSGALLVGKFDVSQHPSVSLTPHSIEVTFKNSKKNRIRPMVDARIGLEWTPCLFNSFNCVIGVAYEIQYWWNQWQTSPSVESGLITGGATAQGDLMMHGLVVKAGISF